MENIITINESKIVNLKDSSITTEGHLMALVVVSGADTKAILRGNEGGVDAYSRVESFNSNNDYNMAVNVKDGAKLLIEGGVYKAGYETVYINAGEVEITGGTFFAQFDGSRTGSNNVAPYELNCHDAEYKSGEAKFYVKGGKFIGFNPAMNASEHDVDETTGYRNTNFVCVGYKAVKTGKYSYKCKDVYERDGELKVIPSSEQTQTLDPEWSYNSNTGIITCPVYEVVPSSDPREGVEGTVVMPSNN